MININETLAYQLTYYNQPIDIVSYLQKTCTDYNSILVTSYYLIAVMLLLMYIFRWIKTFYNPHFVYKLGEGYLFKQLEYSPIESLIDFTEIVIVIRVTSILVYLGLSHFGIIPTTL